MMTGSVIVGSALVGVIVCTPAPGMANVITSGSGFVSGSGPSTLGLLLAQVIAARSEPVPPSAVFVTTKLQAVWMAENSEDSIGAELAFRRVAVAVKILPVGVVP